MISLEVNLRLVISLKVLFFYSANKFLNTYVKLLLPFYRCEQNHVKEVFGNNKAFENIKNVSDCVIIFLFFLYL